MIGQAVGSAFAETFGAEPELVYEISHNLVQEETHPDLFEHPVWVHRKGATRALPAGHPMLAGTRWETTGHPVIIPGSMGDFSYVLRPLPAAGSRAPAPAARSARPRPIAACATSGSW
jgi:tRNA-splicing ligase RtcB